MILKKNEIYEVIIKNLNNEEINYTFLLHAGNYQDAFLKLSKQVDDTIQWQDNNKQASEQKG